MNKKIKVSVLGLDGASFNLINPWLKEGFLPNFKKIIDNGVSCDLESCLPSCTYPAWKCYSTGKNPGKIGIFWFLNFDFQKKDTYLPSERLELPKEFWLYLSENNVKSGIMYVPGVITKKINGFNISCNEITESIPIAYPTEINEILVKYYTEKNVLKNKKNLTKNNYIDIEETITKIKDKFQILKELLSKYDVDFLHLTIFHINILQHFFWNAKETKRAWKIVDNELKFIIENSENTIIMSDHGTNEINEVFWLNNWLISKNYLKLHRKLALNFMVNHKINPNISQELPHFIDYDNTLYVGHGNSLYKNPLLKTEEEEKLIKELIKLKNPVTGNRIIKTVFKKEDIYFGPFLSEAPDIILEPNPNIHIRGGLSIINNIFNKNIAWRADNRKDGIFIACGEIFKKGVKLKRASIYDLAPTILHIFGIPIPDDMDGRILWESLKEEK